MAFNLKDGLGINGVQILESDSKIDNNKIKNIPTLPITGGGTGASTATAALVNLGAAPLASPALTGIPTVPTAVDGTNTTQIASTAYVRAAIAALIASAPGTLDTLDELAAALGDDPNFATTISTALANRVRVDTSAQGLTAGQKTAAKTNLDLANVDNTSDANKPVSTAANAADQAIINTVTALTAQSMISRGGYTLAGGVDANTLLPGLYAYAPGTGTPSLNAPPVGYAYGHILVSAVGSNGSIQWAFPDGGSYPTLIRTQYYANGWTPWRSIVSRTDLAVNNVDNTSDANKPVSTAQQTALNLKANLVSPTFTGTVSGVTKAMVGLGSADNTADVNKPVSSPQQTALNLKADLASPTFTGTVSGITKTMVGLGNADNTADTAKPVSTAQQTALNLKANLVSPTFTSGVVISSGGFSMTANNVGVELGGTSGTANAPYIDFHSGATATDYDSRIIATGGTGFSGGGVLTVQANTIALSGNVTGVNKTMVGLTNVDNTADTAKPVSTAQQTALNLKADLISPTFTGTPLAPTANNGTNTTQIANTAFVKSAIDAASLIAINSYNIAKDQKFNFAPSGDSETSYGTDPKIGSLYVGGNLTVADANSSSIAAFGRDLYLDGATTNGVVYLNSRGSNPKVIVGSGSNVATIGLMTNPTTAMTVMGVDIPFVSGYQVNVGVGGLNVSGTSSFASDIVANSYVRTKATLPDSLTGNIVPSVDWVRVRVGSAVAAVYASPAFTGTPTAPTATLGTTGTQLATLSFVRTEAEADVLSVGSAAAWQLIGTLPITSSGTIDTMIIEGVAGTWTAGQYPYKVITKNRNVFYAKWYRDSTANDVLPDGYAGIQIYANADGSKSVYMVGKATYVTISADTSKSVGVSRIRGSVPSTTAPTGTLVFDSTNSVTYPPIDSAPTFNPTFTGTVSGITKAMVALGNVDNTSDVNKPVSTAQQTALNLKSNLASPTFTGTPAAPTATAGTNTTQLATTAFVTAMGALKSNLNNPTFTGGVGVGGGMTVAGGIAITSGGFSVTTANAAIELGTLGTVNTPLIDFHSSSGSNDYDSRIIASGGVAGTIGAGTLSFQAATIAMQGNVTGISKAMIGLGNADNTSDANKPISVAAQSALSLKAPTVSTMVDRGAFEVSGNWNTLIAPGTYQMYGSNSNFGTGAPPATYAYGQLVVTVGGVTVMQFYYPSNGTGDWYQRASYDNGVGYGPWSALSAEGTTSDSKRSVGSVGVWDAGNYRRLSKDFTVTNRDSNDSPDSYANGVAFEFKNAPMSGGPSGQYSGLMTFAPWASTSASTGGPAHQMAFSWDRNLRYRAGLDKTWDAWRTVVMQGDFIQGTAGANFPAAVSFGYGSDANPAIFFGDNQYKMWSGGGILNLKSADLISMKSRVEFTDTVYFNKKPVFLNLSSEPSTDANALAGLQSGGFSAYYLSSGATNKPPIQDDGTVLTMNYNGGGYANQLFMDWRTGFTWTRSQANVAWSTWVKNAFAMGRSGWGVSGASSYIDDNVARHMAWMNYGNGHTIVDISNSISPTGQGIPNNNAQAPWTTSYPCLVGWNGSTSYGVRVDSSRTADFAEDAHYSSNYDTLSSAGQNYTQYNCIASSDPSNGGTYDTIRIEGYIANSWGGAGGSSNGRVPFRIIATNRGGLSVQTYMDGIETYMSNLTCAIQCYGQADGSCQWYMITGANTYASIVASTEGSSGSGFHRVKGAATGNVPAGTLLYDTNQANLNGFTQYSPLLRDTASGRYRVGGDQQLAFGPNSVWGASLVLGGLAGGNPDYAARMATTNGNMHIDSAPQGQCAVYLNFYSGTGGIRFGNGASNIVADVNVYGDFSGRTFYPRQDANGDLGGPSSRFTNLYLANNPTVTSDARKKFEIEETVWGLDFVSKLRPVTYRLKETDATSEFVEGEMEETIEPVFADEEVISYEIEVVDGKPIRKKKVTIKQTPVMEDAPVFDEDGEPVMETLDEIKRWHEPVYKEVDIEREDGNEDGPKLTEKVLVEEGYFEVVREEQERPLTHPVQKTRKVMKPTTVSQNTMKVGTRKHSGLIAQEVRDTILAMGRSTKDFAGYIYDESTDTYSLRYEQFIAPLIKAVQELTARVAELEAEKEAAK